MRIEDERGDKRFRPIAALRRMEENKQYTLAEIGITQDQASKLVTDNLVTARFEMHVTDGIEKRERVYTITKQGMEKVKKADERTHPN